MSFFSNILEKIGLKKKEETAPAPAPVAAAPAPVKPAPVKPAAQPFASASPHSTVDKGERDNITNREAAKVVEPKPVAISDVDVVKKLEEMAAGSDFDWKVSIVDLLKVLGLDSGKDSRIELAKELGCPAELIGGDYAKMNVWLHKEVLRQIAQNGGNIPKELLD